MRESPHWKINIRPIRIRRRALDGEQGLLDRCLADIGAERFLVLIAIDEMDAAVGYSAKSGDVGGVTLIGDEVGRRYRLGVQLT